MQTLQQKKLQDREEPSEGLGSGRNGTLAIPQRAKPRQVARYHQVSTRAEHLQAVGNGLVKQEGWKRALQNLSKAYQAGAKSTQRPLQSGKRTGYLNEDGKNRPQEILALMESARL